MFHVIAAVLTWRLETGGPANQKDTISDNHGRYFSTSGRRLSGAGKEKSICQMLACFTYE